ncbi:MAG: hypothetical protein Q8P84_00745 [Deltaproteobacteria bacterium]|nr:hypothetical protein [Deltaproteobacteria bacterium]
MDYMSQFWSGLFNLAGQATRDIVQGIIANGYFNSQIKINDRQASAAEKTAEIQGEWLGRQAESFDEQNRLLYGPNGYARDRDRVQSQTAIAMNEAKERGKTERAALQGVDEAFGLDSRDSYGYGNPFAA